MTYFAMTTPWSKEFNDRHTFFDAMVETVAGQLKNTNLLNFSIFFIVGVFRSAGCFLFNEVFEVFN